MEQANNTETINSEEVKETDKPALPPAETAPETSSPLSPMEKADAIIVKIEEAEKRLDEKLARINDEAARRIIGGKAEAGTDLSKQETEQEKLDAEVKENIARYL